ncbi:MAG: hypothetical protein JSV25_12120 [Spirochaetota bacterium]|nr:MAG: hypothetical protein JSV25_12120 [Spirochaetota bacterium]
MKASKKKKIEGKGLFSRLFGKEGAQEKRCLRILKKELSAQRIDIYKIKHDTISPPIAKLIYEIYRLSYPLKKYLQLDDSQKRFMPSFNEKFIVSFHTDKALELQEKLSQDYIKTLAVKHGMKKATSLIEKMSDDYFEQFDREKIVKINSIYTNLVGFARFVHFDFYPFLREFDTRLEEANFIKKPSFSSAEGSLLKDDLIKVHRALFRFDVDENLDLGMDIVNKIHGVETISKSGFSKLKNLILRVQTNDYISLIIRAINKSLSPVATERRTQIDIYQGYSQKRKAEVTKLLSTIKGKYREEEVGSIVEKLFTGEITSTIKNYQEVNNESFRSLNLPLYKWVEPLNFLRVFIKEKHKPSIENVINELIVGGIFINKSTLNDLSNTYYALRSSLDVIEAFNSDLDIGENRGRRIKRLLDNIEKEKGAREMLGSIINETNKRAKLIIDEQIVSFREMAYCLRNILEDYKKKTPVIIANLKKIRAGSNRQFVEELLQSYKDIYLFLKLLSHYVSINVSREEVKEKKGMTIEKTL